MFLVPPRYVHRDRRPDQQSKQRPFTSILFCLFGSCVFSARHGSRRSSSFPSQLIFGVGVCRDRRETAGRSSVKFAGRYEVSPPIVALSSPPAAAHLSLPVTHQSSSSTVAIPSPLAIRQPSSRAAAHSSLPAAMTSRQLAAAHFTPQFSGIQYLSQGQECHSLV